MSRDSRTAATPSNRREHRHRRSSGGSGRSSGSSRSSSSSHRCLRLRRKQIYVALLLGSVLTNVVQLSAFFWSHPVKPHTYTLQAAHKTYHAVVRRVGSILSRNRTDSGGTMPSSPSTAAASATAAATATSDSAAADGGAVVARSDAGRGKRRSERRTASSASAARPAAGAGASSAAAGGGAAAAGTGDAATAAASRGAANATGPGVGGLDRHPRFRIGLTVPWIGSTFPSWFRYFLASCARSAYVADWLIFHEGAELPTASETPPNVIFHDMGKDGLGVLFGTKIARALGMSSSASKLVSLFQVAFREFAYIVTEYKPTHGTVFADYLKGYSHWSYTDIDMLIGDLPLHIQLDELSEYDIFTYHFGDVFRLYLRGQFAAHSNVKRVNMLWAECPHLGSGLIRELEAKHQIVKRLAKEGKRGRTRFISAEGCYSSVVARTDGMRLKFASKAFADWSNDAEFYVVDGAVRKCPSPSQVWRPRGSRPQQAHRAASDGECFPFGPRVAPHSPLFPGVQRPRGDQLPLVIHNNCSRWVESRYRLCANLTEEQAPEFNVMLRRGRWVASRFTNLEPAGAREGAFLHLQRWKGDYKRLSYGGAGMPPLRGRRLFKLSRFGFSVIDAPYDDETGADVQALASAAPPKDLTEMDDEEWERQQKSQQAGGDAAARAGSRKGGGGGGGGRRRRGRAEG